MLLRLPGRAGEPTAILILMENKFTKAAQRVAGNFQSADVQPVAEPFVSEADARGMKAPPLSDAQRTGLGIQFAQASAYISSLDGQEKWMQEKAAAKEAQDAAIMARVRARTTIS